MKLLILLIVFLTVNVCALSVNFENLLYPQLIEWNLRPRIMDNSDNSSYVCYEPHFYPADFLCCKGALCSEYYLNPLHPWVIRRAEIRINSLQGHAQMSSYMYRKDYKKDDWKQLGAASREPLFKMWEIDEVHIRYVSKQASRDTNDHVCVYGHGLQDQTNYLSLLTDIDNRIKKSACSSSPCRHHSTCITSDNRFGYFCICSRGYGGQQCENLWWLD